MEIIKVLEDNTNNYVPWRSFFYKLKGYINFEFQNENQLGTEVLLGKIKDFDIDVKNLKVIKG